MEKIRIIISAFNSFRIHVKKGIWPGWLVLTLYKTRTRTKGHRELMSWRQRARNENLTLKSLTWSHTQIQTFLSCCVLSPCVVLVLWFLLMGFSSFQLVVVEEKWQFSVDQSMDFVSGSTTVRPVITPPPKGWTGYRFHFKFFVYMLATLPEIYVRIESTLVERCAMTLESHDYILGNNGK